MRCIFDANVFVAALLSRSGTPAVLVRAWLDGAFELVVSPLLLEELARVLAYPKIRSRIGEAEGRAFLELVRAEAVMVEDVDAVPVKRSPDPDDDFLVVLAERSRAILVTGDAHLLGMTPDLPVYSPARFQEMLSGVRYGGTDRSSPKRPDDT